MNNDPYFRRAALLRVIDGDTLRLHVDLGWNVASDHNVRLLRVNAPEMKLATKALGLASKMFVEGWMVEHAIHSLSSWVWPFTIRSEKDDAFGRYLCEVWCGEGHNLNDDLLTAGFAVEFVK